MEVRLRCFFLRYKNVDLKVILIPSLSTRGGKIGSEGQVSGRVGSLPVCSTEVRRTFIWRGSWRYRSTINVIYKSIFHQTCAWPCIVGILPGLLTLVFEPQFLHLQSVNHTLL